MAEYDFNFDDDQQEKRGWGFKWNHVGLGLALVGVGAVWLVGGLLFDRLFFVPIGLAIVGIYYLIDGLGGEDGVW